MSLVGGLRDVVPTPPDHRVLISRAEALDTLRCTPEELAQLVAAGLVEEDGRHDYCDVWNVGLLSGTGRSSPERIMIFFARMLKSYGADWVSARAYEIVGWAQCPRAEHCPSSEWSVPDLPDVQWQHEEFQVGRAEWRGRVELSGNTATVRDPRAREVWGDLIRRYRFHFTPMTLSSDVAGTRHRGVGDCDSLCQVLMSELLDRGVAAEQESGYIFGGARLGLHSWVRMVDTDGEAKILDPAMALLSDLFFTPEYKAFCCGSGSNRVLRRARREGMFAAHPCVTEDGRIFYEFTLRSIRPGRAPGPRCSEGAG